MGKVVAAPATTAASETTKKRKKKGRPSLLDLKKRALEQQHHSSSNPNFNSPNSRSTRRNPNSAPLSPSPDSLDPDDDDERKEKKVKLVVRLPQHSRRSSSLNSASSDSDSNADDAPDSKINAKLAHHTLTPQGEKNAKATNTLHGGSPLESGPTTPLPGRKLLVFILDRLQKKDTHGVFSEPVDPEELPDYHDIIEHPMDFGTVRKKLDKGVYSNLEQLEADVLLICSNAMQYNPPNTVFFRQAKSIQELAKRDFENLRQEGEDGELQPKVVRRGRPPTKHLKKQQQQQQPPLGGSPAERVGLECATLATFEDNSIGPSNSNAYNLRRPPPPLHRFHSTDATPNSHRSRNANASADNNNHSEYFSNWNEEFPASILKADMKYGNKQFLLDETRRDTYKEFHPTAAGYEPFALYNVGGDMKQLMAVGLHSEHGYARSLARFAANLGPVVWKVASKKFSSVLPPGVKLGPAGLATENSSSPSHLQRNGLKAGVFGYNNNNNNSNSNSSSQVGGLEIASSQMPPCSTPANKNPEDDDEEVEGDLGESSSKGGGGGPESGKLSSVHNNKRQYGSGVPPDLNVRIFGPGSPNSSATAAALRIASPKQQQQQHPDLALQL